MADQFEDITDLDYFEDIQKKIPGIKVTSGYRTPEYVEDMRRRGYKPAHKGGHLDGSKLDFVHPNGTDWLKKEIKKLYPEAIINPNEHDHADVKFPGYRAAPAVGEAVPFGVVNPNRDTVEWEEVTDEPSGTVAKTEQNENTPVSNDPLADAAYNSGVAAPVQEKKGEFDKSIDRQGGWGLSPNTLAWLGFREDMPMSPGNIPAAAADSLYRVLQGQQAITEATALAIDELAEKVGIADAISYDGNRFLPGSGFLALMEAFPLGGIETGIITPRVGGLPDNEAGLTGKADESGNLVPMTPEEVAQLEAPVVAANDAALPAPAGAPRFVVPDNDNTGSMTAQVPAVVDPSVRIEPDIPANDLETLGTPETFVRMDGGEGTQDVTVFNDAEARQLIEQRTGIVPPGAPPRQPPGGGGGDIPPGDGGIPPSGDLPEGSGGTGEYDLKYAGNINLNRLGTTEDADYILRRIMIDYSNDPLRNEEVVNQASELLSTRPIDEIINHDPAISEAPAYGAAKRTILSMATNKLAKTVADVRANPEPDLAAARDEMKYLFNVVNAATEGASKHSKAAGRALQAQRIKGDPKDAAVAAAVDKQLNRVMDTDEDVMRMADAIHAASNNPEAMQQLAKDAMKPFFEDYITSTRYAMMLSGIGTHIKNVIGTGLIQAQDMAVHGVAAGVGKGRSFFTGSNDRVTSKEVTARFLGMKDALFDAATWMKTRQAFKEGTPQDKISKMEHSSVILPAGLNWPQKALAAEDQFFRSIISNGALNGLAYRQATKEGLKGPALEARAQELIQNPTQKMLKATQEEALVNQLMSEGGAIVKKVNAMKGRKPGMTASERMLRFAVQNAIPFATPTENLFRHAARHSPLGVFSGRNQADWKAGGAKRDIAISRVALGSTVVGILAVLAENGDLTDSGPSGMLGAPKRQQEEAGGKQWESIRIGDEWFSLAGFDNINTTAKTVATIINKKKRGEFTDEEFMDEMVEAIATASNLVASSTYLENFASVFDLAKAGEEGERGAQKYATDLAGSAVPALARQANRFIDPNARDTTGDGSTDDRISGRMKAGVPGMSDDLPKKHDVYGREIKDQSGWLSKVLGVGRTKDIDKDPAIMEMTRLQEGTKTPIVGPPGKNVKVDGYERRLTAEEFQQYQKLSGSMILDGFREAMADPSWKDMSDEDRRVLLDKIKDDARKTARGELFPSPQSEEEEVFWEVIE